MRNKLLAIFTAFSAIFSAGAVADNGYGLPAEIKDGNILHCFDWRLSDIRKELPAIAEAGFTAVQITPVQRTINSGWNWTEAYRPADFTFYQSGIGTKNDLINLCADAESYGIKVIVDVVFNHVDSGNYHNSWWDSNGRLRSTTNNVNYNDRNSITHDRVVNCPEVNTESTEVIARAKAYIEELKGYGVKGIRFDAAKHIGLPSEGSNFWKEVCSVPGMFYYGEILGTPGGSNSNNLLKEYASYMSVTDESYSEGTRRNAGVPSSAANFGASLLDESKCVYWGESHDTYANAGGASQNVSQAIVDRAYAILACRNKGIGLYLSRPNSNNYGSILIGQKGSMHFADKQVAEVNKFKNAMVGKAHSYANSGNVAVVTRQNGGAVIVNRPGSGTISITNAGGYCPAGKYYDRVSGAEFTVTSSTISGSVGSSGIAVIYGDYKPGDDVGGGDDEEEFYIYNTNPYNWSNVYVYMYSSGGAALSNGNWPGERMTKNGDLWEYKVPTELAYASKVIFNDGGNGNQYPADEPGKECGLDMNGKSMISDGNTWKEYETGAVDSVFDDEEFSTEGAIWFNLQGVRVTNPTQPGIYIAVSPAGKTKKILIR